ncbi:hypothetical protein TRFO_32826 [Tritrichomonas foetus]|uniref:Uncharacterized protein n=1 Tax=Tritrichomonas foetus TaxID=1144522 RepID=A0A1J4JSG4_9EUKA|nr:hypothetical protein TRFO_32826 [Tritrichomonas foetus]|eukprot:OHT00468.1 hypothetical protein TRFO_32826 [Tritrichomonas foetus]
MNKIASFQISISIEFGSQKLQFLRNDLFSKRKSNFDSSSPQVPKAMTEDLDDSDYTSNHECDQFLTKKRNKLRKAKFVNEPDLIMTTANFNMLSQLMSQNGGLHNSISSVDPETMNSFHHNLNNANIKLTSLSNTNNLNSMQNINQQYTQQQYHLYNHPSDCSINYINNSQSMNAFVNRNNVHHSMSMNDGQISVNDPIHQAPQNFHQSNISANGIDHNNHTFHHPNQFKMPQHEAFTNNSNNSDFSINMPHEHNLYNRPIKNSNTSKTEKISSHDSQPDFQQNQSSASEEEEIKLIFMLNGQPKLETFNEGSVPQEFDIISRSAPKRNS